MTAASTKNADIAFPRPTINRPADALAEAVSMLESIRLGFTYSADEFGSRLSLLRLHMSDKQRSRLHTRLISAERAANSASMAPIRELMAEGWAAVYSGSEVSFQNTGLDRAITFRKLPTAAEDWARLATLIAKDEVDKAKGGAQ